MSVSRTDEASSLVSTVNPSPINGEHPILGVSADYHDAAAALVIDGRISGAAAEERFTRIKHDAPCPTSVTCPSPFASKCKGPGGGPCMAGGHFLERSEPVPDSCACSEESAAP